MRGSFSVRTLQRSSKPLGVSPRGWGLKQGWEKIKTDPASKAHKEKMKTARRKTKVVTIHVDII